jgi:hypothetical protein
MTNAPNEEEAARALESIHQDRAKVIEQIAVPSWYWWGLAGGWIVLGVVSDDHNPWLISAATLAFGAAHASIAHWVIGGRQGSTQIRVSEEVAGPFTPWLIIGCLVGLVGLTIIGAVAASDNGVSHPVTIASVGVAIIIVLGGPRLMSVVRRHAARRLARSWS